MPEATRRPSGQTSSAAARRPTVSAVIVVFNQAQFIADAIRSALAQSDVDVEVIVVDDASTDDTPAVLASLGDRITVLRNETGTERGAARNRGARAGRGEFIAFLDGDDCWMPGKLIAQVKLCRLGQACVTQFDYVDAHGRVIGGCRPRAEPTLAEVVSGPVTLGAGSNLMVTREMFEQTGGFPEDLAVQSCEDWLFVARLLGSGVILGVVPVTLVRVTVHDRQSTATALRRTVLWRGAAWLEEHGYVSASAARRLRARVAGVIAAGYAFEGTPGAAMRWLRHAARQRETRETARALLRVARSFATGALRRRGLGRLVDSIRARRTAFAARPRRAACRKT